MHAVKNLFFIVILCISFISSMSFTYEQALVVQPVIDLIGLSFCKEYALKDSTIHYKDIPVCAKTGKNACVRLHQLVYNEQVTILETFEDEVRIEISHLFFQTGHDNTQHIGYWTHKKNIVPFDVLQKKELDFSLLPQPISFVNHVKNNQELAIVIEPTYDPITNRTYSAGTRFVRAHTDCLNKHHVTVYALMPSTLEQVIIELPKKNTLVEIPTNPSEQQKLFVAILKKWAHPSSGFIPYVWGGCSYLGECQDHEFSLSTRKIPSGMCEFWAWPSLHTIPLRGFDCAGIISRATQLAGMPYFFKNTTTLSRNMHSIAKGQQLEAGDLIWVPGHVMVISDVQKNSMIEARGYTDGYGKVQELKLQKVFEGIRTYNQLLDAYFNKTPLKRLNHEGIVTQTFPTFKILKMASIWPDYKHASKH